MISHGHHGPELRTLSAALVRVILVVLALSAPVAQAQGQGQAKGQAKGQAPAPVHEPVKEQVYKLGHMFATGSLPDKAAQRFASLVAERTGATVKVAVFSDGQLGDERENIAQLRKGLLNFAVTGDVVVSSLGDKYRIVNMPFIYRDVQHALRTYDSELGEAIRAKLRQEGIEVLSWHYIGTRMLTANRPIRNVADLKGLELRLPQDSAWTATWQALGARTRQVPFTELPRALAVGQVDAQENPPNFIRTNRLYEHQKYLMTTNHLPQRQMILASGAAWNRLPESRRAQILAAAREASDAITRQAVAEQEADLQWLVGAGGMTKVEFDASDVQAAIAPVPGLLAGPDGDQILEQIRRLR